MRARTQQHPLPPKELPKARCLFKSRSRASGIDPTDPRTRLNLNGSSSSLPLHLNPRPRATHHRSETVQAHVRAASAGKPCCRRLDGRDDAGRDAERPQWQGAARRTRGCAFQGASARGRTRSLLPARYAPLDGLRPAEPPLDSCMCMPRLRHPVQARRHTIMDRVRCAHGHGRDGPLGAGSRVWPRRLL